jgi:hypothetical protein
MRALRILATGVGAVATFHFIFWMGGALLFQVVSVQVFPWLDYAVTTAASVVVARFIWVNTKSRETGFAVTVALWALLTGAIAFLAGFYGPILLTPRANQGPMLGLFFTGPLGLVVGALAGAIYWLLHKRFRSGTVGTVPPNNRWRGP